ncbi:MAG: FtsX-like permease family protein [Lysobacteraceae bacterium]|nr:MAG: FtsX-like permease family protein [Xanthomonadaceae bacterium]
MELHPMLSTLLRQKTAAALIVLEIALSCAIVCNAIFLIAERADRIGRESGLVEDEIVQISVSSLGAGADEAVRTRRDIAELRAIPGVKAVSSVNQIPYGGSSWNSSVNLTADQQMPNFNAGSFLGDDQMLEAFGLKLIAGRDFNAEEYVEWEALSAQEQSAQIPSAIVTRAFAEKLFPGQDAIGKSFHAWGDAPIRIVGIVESVLRPNDSGGPGEGAYSMFFPVNMTQGNYVLRSAAAQREQTLTSAVAALNRIDPNRIINSQRSLTEMRSDYYARDRAVVWLLLVVCAAMLTITAFGIGGLASFWVQQRTKQIGIRRALGATRKQILRYFQAENFILATLGIMLGMLGAYGINQWLVSQYELPRLPALYLPIGAIALWLLGQIAVLGPARRAATVPPATATRSI